MPSRFNPGTRDPIAVPPPHTTGIIPRGKHGVPRVMGGGKERKMARGWVSAGREGQPLIPYTPACVLISQSSVQQEDRALG